MSAMESRAEGLDGAGMGAEAWFALGTGRVGARLLGAARIAAVLHEDAVRGLGDEGVGVEERLMLFEGVGMEDVA